MHILMFLLFGLVVGVIARMIVPRKDPGGWAVSMFIGIGGAMLGGFLGRLVGLYGPGQAAGFVMSVVGAIALIFVYHLVVMQRRPV